MRGPSRRALLALALVALLALEAPGVARGAEEDDDSSSSAASEAAAAGQGDAPATAAPPAPPPPPPPKRSAEAKLAFCGDAAAYSGADDAVPSSARKAAPGKPLLTAGAASSVAAGASLSIAFQTTLGGKPAAPQQAVLRLAPASAAGPSAYVWARRRKGGEPGDLVATVTHAEVARQLGRVPAALAATLLIGDPSAGPNQQGAEWPLGEVRFAEAEQAAAAEAAAAAAAGGKAATGGGGKQPKLLTASHQPLHNAVPDIRHTFRRPDRRAPAPVSLLFTALALLPLVALVPALAATGANLKGWPADPTAAAWALAFLASLASVLLLLVVFWLRLTLATAFWPAAALGSALWFTGWRALRAQASARVLAEGGGSKKKD